MLGVTTGKRTTSGVGTIPGETKRVSEGNTRGRNYDGGRGNNVFGDNTEGAAWGRG